MKFISLKENLKQALSIVAHLTTKNINLPILNNILIKVKKEGIELISTNLEISISHFLRGKIEKDGEFIVDSKIINDYIALLPEDKIEIEADYDKNELKIKCNNYKTKIKGNIANDFPILPIKNTNIFYKLNLLDFKNALSNVISSVSNNENRIELSGVFFNFENKKLTLAGTDSYRLSEKTINFKTDDILDQKSVIVPARTVQELIRILNNFKVEEQLSDDNEIKIYINESQIFFSFASTDIVSRIITGNYPDYKQIIPEKERTSITVLKQDLVKAVKVAGIFSKTGINDIGVSVNNNLIKIFSSSSQAGENLVEIKCSVTGDENEIYVNYKYLLEGLNNINSDNIILKIIDNNTPCIISAENDDSFLYLVMPIKQ